MELEYDAEYDNDASSWIWSAGPMTVRVEVYDGHEYDAGASSWTCRTAGEVRMSDRQSRDGLGTSVQGRLSGAGR